MPAIKRPIFKFGVLVLTLAGLLLVLVLTTSWPAEWLRPRLAQAVAEATGGSVSIDAMELRFFPPRVFLKGVQVQEAVSGAGAWGVQARAVDLILPYRVYVGRFDRVDALQLEEPRIILRPAAGKPSPEASSPESTGEGKTFSIGRLEIEGGSMRYSDSSHDWAVEIAKVLLRGEEAPASHALEGRLEESLLVLRKNGREWEAPLKTQFRFDGKGVSFPDFHLNGEQDSFKISGSVEVDASGSSPSGVLQAKVKVEPPLPSTEGWGALWGNFQLKASGRLEEGGLQLQGEVEGDRFGYSDQQGKNLQATWSYHSGSLQVEEMGADLWGGRMTAEAAWQPGSTNAEASNLETQITLSGISVQPLMTLLDLDRLGLMGTLDHQGQYALQDFQPGTLAGDGTISLNSWLPGSQNRPMQGEAVFQIRKGVLEIDHANLSSLATHLSLRGSATLTQPPTLKGNLELESDETGALLSGIDSGALARWAPLEELLHGSREARARLEGEFELGESGLSLRGRLRASDLVFRDESLGNLESDFIWSGREIRVPHFQLEGGRTRAHGSGSYCLADENDGRPSFVEANGEFSDLRVEWLRDWLGTDFPVAGDLSARVEFSGASPSWKGIIDWSLGHPQLGALPLQEASGRFRLEPGGVLVEQFRLQEGDGWVSAGGRVGLGGEPLSLVAQARNLDLSWLRAAGLEGPEVEGRISGNLEATGTLSKPEVEAHLEGKDLVVKKFGLGAVSMHITVDAKEGLFEILPDEKGVALHGSVIWEADRPFQVVLKLNQWSVPLPYLTQETGLEQARLILSGDVEATGAISDLSRLDVSGSLTQAEAWLGAHRLEAKGPVVFRWRPPNLELTPFHLLGLDSDLALSGELDPVAGVYRFAAEGNFPLTVLAPLWPDLNLDGKGALSLTLARTEDRMVWRGWLDVADGRMQGGGLPFPVAGLTGRVTLEPDGRFGLEGVRMKAGGGDLNVRGGGRLKTLDDLDLDLKFDGTNIEIRYPEGFRARYDLDLRLLQAEAGSDLTGDIRLVRGAYAQDFEIESRLLSLGGRGPAPIPVTAEREPDILDSIRLDLALKADRELWIKNDFATLEGAAVLKVGGTMGAPELTGRFTAFEGGRLYFNRVRYRVVRGNIDLIDPDRINPFFDLRAETHVGNYQVNLQFDGTLDSFTYELSSSPPLSQADIVSLLVSGRTLEKDPLVEPGEEYSVGGMATGYLTAPLTDKIGGQVAKVTGLDQFSIDPIIISREGDPASRLTLGKQISENLFAVYSTVLGNSSREVYQLEYKITSDLKLTSLRESDGAVGGDLRYVWQMRTSREDRPRIPTSIAQTRIRELLIDGEPKLSRRKIMRLLRLGPGKVTNRVQAMEGEERLLSYLQKQGYLQARVDLTEMAVEGQESVDLHVKIEPGPLVEIELRNIPASIDPEEEIRAVWMRTVFPEEAPEDVRSRLEKSLVKHGFVLATVGLEVLEDSPERRRVVLTAYPGPRYEVGSVEFRGNDAISTDELESVLGIRNGKKVFLDPDKPAQDAHRLRGYYRDLGYSEAQISPPILEMNEERSQAIVRFDIDEGEPARITSVRIEGNQSLPDEELIKTLSVKAGNPFSKRRAQNGVTDLRRQYDRHGFAEPAIHYDYQPAPQGDLLYRIEEGPRRYVGKVLVEGNYLTRQEVIERELLFKEGDPLSREAILKSQRALYRLGLFRSVEIFEIPGSNSEHPTLRVLVEETDNLTQSIGGGYSSDGGARGVYEVTNNNVRGNGQTVGLALRGGSEDNSAQVILRDPYLFNRRLDSLLSGFWAKLERESFIERTVGSTFQISKPHGAHNKSIYRYLFKDVNLSNLEITEAEAGVEEVRLSGLASSFVRDTRDNFYSPRSGIFASFNLEGYGKKIGSGAEFWKFLATGKYFRKVMEDSVWASSVRIGLADPFGETELIPLSERFFAGGDTSIRGFDRDEVGPKDPATSEPVGGSTLFILNQEFRYPMWRAIRGLVFLDAGNVTSDLSELDFTDFRASAGLGLRVETPIGPIRLEYGWKLDREEGEDSGRFHLSIGQAF